MLQHRDQIIDELIRQSESSIARIQLSQLASMPQESNTSQSWAFELPLRHGENIDVVQLRIEKEDPKEGEEQDSRWRITLTLDLPAIGTIYATITVQGEQTSTTLWAEEESTAQLIENNLQLLRDALDKHGVSSDEINCQHGSPPAEKADQITTVALMYDGENAPTITAKGNGHIGEEILRIAKENNIPISEGPVTFGNGKTSLFIRDPDYNVIEFTQDPGT